MNAQNRQQHEETIREILTQALGRGGGVSGRVVDVDGGGESEGVGGKALTWREIVSAIYDLRGEVAHWQWRAIGSAPSLPCTGDLPRMYVDEEKEKIVDDLVREVQAGLQSRPVKGEAK